MDEIQEQHELESLIARQPLRQPSAKLDERMSSLFRAQPSQTVASAAPMSFFNRPVLQSALRVAALLALVALIGWALLSQLYPDVKPDENLAKGSRGQTPVQTVWSEFNPVRIEQSWSNLEPEGVVVIDGDPLRRYQRETFDHVQLIDEKNNIRIGVHVASPRDNCDASEISLTSDM